ncbi:hypothetical protein CHU92_00515 [Flavobacterium cyanobacteriorum]|uniref:DUF2809 domain-containing protein n=1 Tax=Flavobacterium cyanobacteriorum TaxID=2022802 RepID=A0A256A5Q4_9FLAO|nr:DUF2809 domain-containing protein [Flavobacterium cyanobacteriorum]OYQ49003.1 hypothetical protein CHU92_00515 [Flavobacterium cyanobacteriorum]
MKISFHKTYFFLTVFLFIIEVLIALYIRDNFIRPYFGDVLVVILIYCFIRSFFRWPVVPVAVGVLLFAFAVEALQYLNIVERLGLKDSKLAKVVIGNSFAWEDMLCYLAGAVIIIGSEKFLYLKNKRLSS